MRRIKILFDVYLIYHLPQFLPFYELIKDDNRFDIYFTAGGHSRLEREKATKLLIDSEFQVISGESEEERCKNIDALDIDYLIIGWGRRGYLQHITNPSHPCVIMIYHGIGVKASYFKDNSPRIDYRVVESPYRESQLKKYSISSKLLLTGFIKLDPLYKKDFFNREMILADLGLSSERKTILYAPTYYPSSIGIVKDAIATATKDYNLIIKLHNYTRHHSKYSEDMRLIEGIVGKYSHARLVPESWYNIIPLLYISDILITDASSVMFEYLPLDRPIIVFHRYKLILRHKLFRFAFRQSRIDKETISHTNFYDIIKNPASLQKTIEDNFLHQGKYASERHAVAEKMLHFNDGRSAERLLEYFEEILKRE